MRKSFAQLRLHREYWLVAHVCADLGRYYRHLFNLTTRTYGIAASNPSWGPHISIIRDECPLANQCMWQAFHETQIEFEYGDTIKTEGRHIWVDVHCEEMHNIRELFGLPRDPIYPFHITVGVFNRDTVNDPRLLRMPKRFGRFKFEM